MEQKKTGIAARIASFGYAFKGIATLIKTQPNAKFHLIATIGITIGGFAFGITAEQWIYLSLAMAIVWVAEGLNTAIEFVVDLVSPDYHELAGKAKDVAAGAVLLAAIFAAVVGGIVFIPEFIQLFSGT